MDNSDPSAALPTPARPEAVTGMAIRVGVYLRQSELRVTGSEASTAAQHRECLKALESWDVPPAHVEVYEDLGISAFKNVERPGYERLLRDVRAGRINVIMVHYMSRLSRKSPAETYDELRPLLTNRVRIISVGERREFHTDNPLALMELLLKLQAGHDESMNKSRAVKAAKALEASLGGYTGKVPFGFTLVRETRRSPEGKPVCVKVLTPDENHEAPIVRRIVDIVEKWIATDDTSGSCWNLARRLDAEGHLTRGRKTAQRHADASWDDRTLKRILVDPRIAGFACESRYGVRRDGTPSNKVVEYRVVRDDRGNPVAMCEPIVSPERWYRVQQWLRDRHPGGGDWHGRAAGALSAMKLLYCECGAYMTHGGSGFKKHYRCRRRAVEPGQHMGTVTIGAKGIEEYLARQVLAMIAAAQHDEAAMAVLTHATARYEQEQERVRIEELSPGELPCSTWLPPEGTDPVGPGSWWWNATRDDKRAFFRLFLNRVEVRKAYRHAGRGVPTESRVSITWAGGVTFDVPR
ncbi:recombinase family protein [Streptomyces griseorubiginosus]|uniref:recombinase family protein n=1 Tax=Streptomyces griseorubiginosus TaxID=67304 RepID=UPI0036A9F04A